MNLYESLRNNLKEEKKVTKEPLKESEIITRTNAQGAPEVRYSGPLTGSGLSKHVEAVFTPDCLKVYNEEWGFIMVFGEIDTDSMENMSQYWFYNDYENNEEFRARIDKAATALYRKMKKAFDAEIYKDTPVKESAKPKRVKRPVKSIKETEGDATGINLNDNINRAIDNINAAGRDITYSFISFDDDFNYLKLRAYAVGPDGEDYERDVQIKLCDGISYDAIYEAIDTWDSEHRSPDNFYEAEKLGFKDFRKRIPTPLYMANKDVIDRAIEIAKQEEEYPTRVINGEMPDAEIFVDNIIKFYNWMKSGRKGKCVVNPNIWYPFEDAQAAIFKKFGYSYIMDKVTDEIALVPIKESDDVEAREDINELADKIIELIGSDNTDYIKRVLDAVYRRIVFEITGTINESDQFDSEEFWYDKIKEDFGHYIESIEGEPGDHDCWVYLIDDYISDEMECHTVHEHSFKECYKVLHSGITHAPGDKGYGDKSLKENANDYAKLPREVQNELLHPVSIEDGCTNTACFDAYDSFEEMYKNYEDGVVKDYVKEQESKGATWDEVRLSLYECAKEGLVNACFEKYM